MLKVRKFLFLVVIVLMIFNIKSPVIVNAQDDLYEYNDTMQRAYQYENIPVITNTVTTMGDRFTVGFKSAYLSGVDDIDWYKTTLNSGRVFVDIRNLRTNVDYNIELYDSNGNLINSTENSFSGKSEKYFYYICPRRATYYIKIYSNSGVQSSNYFFYVGAERYSFNIKNLQVPACNLFGSSYKKTSINLSNYLPANSSASALTISNDLASGSGSVDKQVYINRTYSMGTSTYVSFGSNVNLNRTITLYGKMSNNGAGTWVPKISGYVTCNMSPYN